MSSEAPCRVLGQWRLPPRQIDAVLRHGVFGPGASGLTSEEIEPGAVIWLVPQRIAIREWAREGAGTAGQLLERALAVGQVQNPPPGLEKALEHVGYSDA